MIETQHGLKWLEILPANYKKIMADLKSPDRKNIDNLASLARRRLDGNQMASLSKCISNFNSNEKFLSDYTNFSLGVTGQVTTNLLCSALPAAAFNRKINLTIIEANYGQPIQQALNSNSIINRSELDAILVIFDYRELNLRAGIEHGIDFVKTLQNALKSASNIPIIFQTIAEPPESYLGSLDLIEKIQLAL